MRLPLRAAAILKKLSGQHFYSASLKLPPSRSHIMSSASFWSDACETAKGKSLQTLLDALHGSCGATVRRARAADCALLAAV